eukprot:scaffold203208_cov18-Tisochrysis_lutea.AAC.1
MAKLLKGLQIVRDVDDQTYQREWDGGRPMVQPSEDDDREPPVLLLRSLKSIPWPPESHEA